MSLIKSIDTKNFYSVFTFTADTSLIELKSELDNLSHLIPNFHRMPMIWDFRRADLSTTRRGQIDQLALYFDQKQYTSVKVKVACVVDGDLQYGLCRILQFYMDEKIVEMRTFKNYGGAIEWISEIEFIHRNLPVNLSVSHLRDAPKQKLS